MIAIREGSGQGGAHDLRARCTATVQERPLVRGNALVLMDPVTGDKRERYGGALHRRFSDLFNKHTTYNGQNAQMSGDGRWCRRRHRW